MTAPEWGPSDIAGMLSYEPQTGIFTWLDRPDSHFSRPKDALIWRRRFLGKRALITDNGRGYLSGNIGGMKVYAHRAAFVLMEGRWPESQVDHINGNPSDNRWTNLRQVTPEVNCRNKSAPQKRSASGILGIGRVSKPSCWIPQVSIANKSIALGATPCLGIAIRRRRAAEKELGFHENHGRSVAAPIKQPAPGVIA